MRKPERAPAVPLTYELEHAVLAALLSGDLAPASVAEGELSKVGRGLRRGIEQLASDGIRPPFDPQAVGLLAETLMGVAPDEVRAALRSASAYTPSSAAAVVVRIHQRRALVEALNAVGQQLQTGQFDVGAVVANLQRGQLNGAAPLSSVADRLASGFPPDPAGISLKSLPTLSSEVGGIFGLWVIGGEPKVGKSTFVWQMALEAGQVSPVLVYDFENGFPTIMSRLRRVFGDDVDRLRAGMTRIYYRNHVGSLDEDLFHLKEPAVVIVDSVQKLPRSTEFQREGLVKWVHRLEGLKRQGHSVVLVSEVPRASYEVPPHIGIYKETGALEYGADVGAQLVRDGDVTHFHVVAHRHRPVTGRITTFRRTREFWFEEL